MKLKPAAATRPLVKYGIAGGLFILFIIIYWVSVPNGFNTVRENRRFFDSDGEFITRQFNQGKTYTHQEHLLYHILAKYLYDYADRIPILPKDPVVIHKLFSVVFGAFGVAGLFLFGMIVTNSLSASLLAALFVAGSAGYWFFSATIDTYIPALCCSIVALGLTLKWLDGQHLSSAVMLGVSMGMAFLFRTDGFLLGSLGLALAGIRKRVLRHVAAVVLAGAIISVVGYATLAHHVYEVDYMDIPAWSLGYQERKAVGNIWGTMKNLTLQNLTITGINQLFYTVLLPGLESTAHPNVYKTMAALRYGSCTLALYLLFLLLIAASATSTLIRGWQKRRWKNHRWRQGLMSFLAIIWLLSRTVLYTWWDPYDPFLFAVMSLPALWLGCLLFLQKKSYPLVRQGWVAVIVLLIWAHNLVHLILPLRALPF